MLKIDLRPKARVLGQFAWFALVGLPAIAAFGLKLGGAFAWTHPALFTAAGIAVVQLILFSIGLHAPTRWLFVGLSALALPIGFVLSHVLMACTYYLVVTPIGLVFRLLRRDVLGRRVDRDSRSFWHDRGAPRPASSYFKLY